jgi:fermentation-respiration switch protein FrsA (DUF1100 family)
LAGFAALGYLGAILVLAALEKRLLFHPHSPGEGWDPPPDGRTQDVRLSSADGNTLHAWWCPTENWEPSQGALLYCHGNAGNLSYRRYAIRDLQRHCRLAVLIVDYPGYGRSTGSPSEAGCYAAADAAYAWLTDETKVPAARVVLFGESLGGGVAVDLASRRPHRALVLWNGFTSVPDVAQDVFPWLPVRYLVRNRFDSLRKIGACRRPVFMSHGTADSIIPFRFGERLFQAANEPKQFYAIRGGDHNDPLNPTCLDALREFLNSAAPLPPPAPVAEQPKN